MREFPYTFFAGFQKGLRKFSENPRNEEALVESKGMFPDNGSLRTIDDLESLPDIGSLGESFPFPQIFNLRSLTLVCGATTLWEYRNGTYYEVISGLTAGSIWSVADFFTYVLAANGRQIVKRDPESFTWSVLEDDEIPFGYSICNVNGQLIVGGPGYTIPDSEVV